MQFYGLFKKFKLFDFSIFPTYNKKCLCKKNMQSLTYKNNFQTSLKTIEDRLLLNTG